MNSNAMSITPSKALNRKGKIVFFLALLALAGSFVIQAIGLIVVALLHMTLNMTGSNLQDIATYEAFAAGSVVLGMLLLGGASWLKPSREDAAYTWRKVWPILAVDVVLMGIVCGSYVFEGAQIVPDWLSNLALTAAICLCVGVFEEFLFRGLILNGLLAVLGKTHHGTMITIAVTSLLFGLFHVNISTNFATPLLATQAVLKIAQTGLFSVILCGIVLHTHRLGGVSLFHCLSDFLLMVPSLVLMGESLSTKYVNSGDQGYEAIIVYLVCIAFYLPFVIKTLRTMHRERLTYRGAFMEKAVKQYASDEANENSDTDLPVSPTTLQAQAS